MAVPYGQLRTVTARAIVRSLTHDGFQFRRQAGSHHRYVHPDGRRVTVSFSQPGDTFPIKTLKSIFEMQARWDEKDLKRLGLTL